MRKKLKKVNKNKIPELFKQEMIIRTIIPALNWKGAFMLFCCIWNEFEHPH